MMDIEVIIELFGGQAELARKLGHKNSTTIAGWKKSGRIPPWRVFELIESAKQHGVKLPEDFPINPGPTA